MSVKTINLTLKGLSCQHCVNRVKQTLEQRTDVFSAEISVTQAIIKTSANTEILISAIEKLGYQAEDNLPPPKNKPQSSAFTKAEQTAESTCSDHYLLIEGMSCASCLQRVSQALQQVKGVTQVQVNLAEQSAQIKGQVDVRHLIEASSNAGYPARVGESADEQARQQYKKLRLKAIKTGVSLLIAIPIMLWSMSSHHNILTPENRPIWLLIAVMSLLVMLLAGSHFYRKAWQDLLHKTASMETLVALSTSVCWLYSCAVLLFPDGFPESTRHLYFESSSMIIGLINLGQMLEMRAKGKASQAIQQLLKLTPEHAVMINQQGETPISVSQITAGMKIKLRSGDRIPVDGIVLEGQGFTDESMLTGEAWPQQKQQQKQVFAGTLLTQGSLIFEAKVTGEKTTLNRIVKQVRLAQSSKAPIGKLADRITAIFVPLMLILALSSALIWWVAGPDPRLTYSLIIMTTVLIIACPCALGLATPMSIIAGVSRAAKAGILVSDASALQHASTIDTLVFDKTGTLTEGTPQVTHLQLRAEWQSQQTVALALAAALEQHSHHPLANAITQYALHPSHFPVTDFEEYPGNGVSGKINEQVVRLGHLTWLRTLQIDTTPIEQWTDDTGSGTQVYMAVDQQLIGQFSLSDKIRPEAETVITQLRQAGYHLVLLSGDRLEACQPIAQHLGIEAIHAGVLPWQKQEVIQALQQQGRRIAMVGDGINDAAALASADTGIALGHGSDIAIESAGLILLRSDLHGVLDSLRIAKATINNIRQNLCGAFIYNCISIPIAAGLLYPVTGWLLDPALASAAMALSSVTVVVNSNRLLRYPLGKMSVQTAQRSSHVSHTDERA